jgi:glycosyltransferase involved in cell wall biosynthesis
MTISTQKAPSLYLDLMERCLLNTIYEDAYTDWRNRGIEKRFNSAMRQFGRDWPRVAHTMIGEVRLHNLRELAELTLADGIPGDFIETGVWRGGACILLRAVLKAHGITDRRVFAADSFEGLPRPDATAYPADAGDIHHQYEELAVSVDQVKANFARYGLLDEQVVFLKGWFKETLSGAPIERLALLRLDGDMYESTIDGLRHLYDKVSPGGFVIVDDYGCVAACRQAVEDFRRQRGIAEPIVDIDGWGVYWRKPRGMVASEMSSARLPQLVDQGSRPFWSVIVPLYERQQFLKQCLDSVLDQDPGRENLEILVIDDASPSDLRGFVERLGRGRVSYMCNATNLGLYASTNIALRRTRGYWLHILHDDDWVLPGFYTTLRRAVESCPPAVGVAFCMYVNHRADNSTWSPPPFRQGPGLMERDFLPRLASANPLNLPAVIYRREAFEQVGLFREDLPYTADWEWYVRSALHFSWYHEPEALACYRVHPDNQTHQLTGSGRVARDIRRTLELFAQILPAELAARILPGARQFHGRHFLDRAHHCVQNGNHALARKLLLEAIAIDPDGLARPEFARLLQQATFSALRHEVRSALLRNLD